MRAFWLIAALVLGTRLCLAASQQQPPSLPTFTAPTVTLPLANVPAGLAGSGSWTSACINMSYYRAFTVFGALAAVGTVQAVRYADAACAQPIGAVPVTAYTLTTGSRCPSASFCGAVASNDLLPFLSMTLTLTDTSGSANAIVAAALLLGAE